jgi:hypothetical protein
MSDLTGKNLDRLSDFLNRVVEDPALAAELPEGAHIFHGVYNDAGLTEANLKLATKILLGMTLGYVEDAPLVMVFEHKTGKRSFLDLSDKPQRQQAQRLIETFQEQSQQDMVVRINELTAV